MIIFGFMAALGLVALATRLKINLAHGMLAGAAVVALTAGMGPVQVVSAVWAMIIEPKSIALVLTVALLMVFSQIQEESGRMEELFGLVKSRITSPKLALVSFPALIGLLPMPGGALFSAPMVKSAGEGLELCGEDKSLINYWFRHIWEYSWPLYPSLILISAMSGVGMGALLPPMVPLTVTAAVAGYFILLRKIPKRRSLTEATDKVQGSLLSLSLPIIIILAGALLGPTLVGLFGDIYPALANLPKQTSMVLALLAAVLLAAIQGGRPGLLGKTVFSRHTGQMIYLILAILAFQAVAVGSGGVGQISQWMSDRNMPVVALVVALPFIMGLISGIAVAYVAPAFPVFLPLLPADNLIPYLVLAHASGFAGVLISPAHACLVLSNRYFRAGLGGIYARMWLVLILTMLSAVAMFFLLHK